ncbi:rhodopsin kinase grk7-b isoform X2 [Mugil cephalus]|uniref:rhodopsin kinase grk7-b isoform X2 n=1 Tax=Mugil cephalus TaxID=48193 RepID=UPI001FB6C823|nr:rhodopsin kinase grk7-b isoform X2 [Mugil cephalus]
MPQDMVDLLGLDNLVANTAYLKAQQIDHNDLKKQRLSLTLPSIKNTSALQESVGKEYESLCEKQPIGKKLFQQFLLTSNPQYVAAAEFLEEVKIWSFADGDTKEKARQSILAKFCQPESKSFLSYLTGVEAEMCKTLSDKNFDEVTVNQIGVATMDFLKGKPFSEYMQSPFFNRFLQWKEYEKQKITDKYFYEFRILGRGGFGEVCAVQVKHTGQMYACKKLDKRHLKKKASERLALLEKQILEKVNSLFIVNLAYAYDNRTHLCLAGTIGYMAPELLKQEHYRTSVDWWALGCSIYEMVAARLPFKDFREKVQNDEVTRRTLEDECKFQHKRFDAPTRDIISRFLKRKVSQRLGCRYDPRSHVFFKSINFHRLEAGLLEPPWVPKLNVVYAKDTNELKDITDVKDVQFDAKDEKFFREFSTGAVSIQWQKEIIDSGVFDELNDIKLNGNHFKSRTCAIL